MLDIKVSEMTEATEVNDDDLLMIVQNDVSKKAKIKNANKQIYSTEEARIGTWIDGKPLYKKTVEFNIDGANGEITKSHNIQDMEKCIDIECVFERVRSSGLKEYFYMARASEDGSNIRN